jgi:hypothetical protein
VLTIEYNHIDYADLLKEFAGFFNSEIVDDTLILPPHIGKGYMKLVELPNGLQGIISDYTVHQKILFKRTRISKDFLNALAKLLRLLYPTSIPTSFTVYFLDSNIALALFIRCF